MCTSWKNTRDALKGFANVLICHKCGSKPINAVRYTNCGHFFCKQCVGNDSICSVCSTPVQPTEICSDHLVNNLVSYCDIIGDIIQEKDLWTIAKSSDQTRLTVATGGRPKANTVKYYIPKKNINKQNAKGETQLHTASVKNQVEHVRALLAAGANPNTKDHTGWTPLQEAVSFGYSEICQMLLENGASSNTPGAGNRRPLHDAVINGRLLEVKMLLQYSANKSVYDDHGKRPIDYCEPHTEMWNILKDDNELNDAAESTTDLNNTLNQSFSTTQLMHLNIIYASNLHQENKRYLDQMLLKRKIKAASAIRSSVTHIIVEANSKNVVQLTYDVMMGLLQGSWLLNTEWIQLGMDVLDVLKGDLELFEVSGAPLKGIPKKARENAQNQNPRLFNHCHFYFALEGKNNYYINNVAFSKEALIALVQTGDGTVLKREPHPEDIKQNEQLIPFHIANEPNHPLYKCTHFIIYSPGRDEPRVKYNMVHIKTLPLMWLIECIEKFTLVDPTQLGLLNL